MSKEYAIVTSVKNCTTVWLLVTEEHSRCATAYPFHTRSSAESSVKNDIIDDLAEDTCRLLELAADEAGVSFDADMTREEGVFTKLDWQPFNSLQYRKNLQDENEQYEWFVRDLYEEQPGTVFATYRQLYPDTALWQEPVDEAIWALAAQDARDGRDAWAFKNKFEKKEEAKC